MTKQKNLKQALDLAHQQLNAGIMILDSLVTAEQIHTRSMQGLHFLGLAYHELKGFTAQEIPGAIARLEADFMHVNELIPLSEDFDKKVNIFNEIEKAKEVLDKINDLSSQAANAFATHYTIPVAGETLTSWKLKILAVIDATSATSTATMEAAALLLTQKEEVYNIRGSTAELKAKKDSVQREIKHLEDNQSNLTALHAEMDKIHTQTNELWPLIHNWESAPPTNKDATAATVKAKLEEIKTSAKNALVAVVSMIGN